MKHITAALITLLIIGVTAGLTYFFGQLWLAKNCEYAWFTGFCSTLYVYVAIGITYLAVGCIR
jgi:hypothetical protein